MSLSLIPDAAPRPVLEGNRSKGGKYRVRIEKSIRTINGGGPEMQFANYNGPISFGRRSRTGRP